MPYSYGSYKDVVVEHLRNHVEQYTKILDVGAGCGTYGSLLHRYFPMIYAIEIFPKYVEMFKFEVWYADVFIGDILNFDYSSYEYLILGDVIEHLPILEAQNLIKNITDSGKRCLVSVPYLFEQGIEYGNVHEIHIQDDLTLTNMQQRYPQLKLLCGDSNYGYYINYDVSNNNK